MKILQILSFALSILVPVAVSSDVVRLVGDSVQLDKQDTVPEFNRFSWMFNRTNAVSEYYKKYEDVQHSSAYKDRVEFNDKTYSLTLKNLQKTDSGLYEARAVADEVTVVAEYRLSVLDPVEAPVLTHKLNKATCNITITCSGHDLCISSSCYNETCEEQEVTSPGGVTLSLSVRGSSIICNHSNPVSWKEGGLELGELKQHCTDGERKDTSGPGSHSTTVVVILVCSILLIILIGFYIYRRRSTGRIQCENTVYAEVEGPGAAIPSALEAPSTEYSVVGKPQSSSNGQSSQITLDPEHEQLSIPLEPGVPNAYESVPDKMQCAKPETIYAAVLKPSKPVNQSKLDETT